MGIFTFIVMFLGAVSAHGEILASAPGWSMTKIEPAQEDNAYNDGPVYYSLQPPDVRPAIRIDKHTADRLRSGQAFPEIVYAGKPENKDEDRGGNQNGIAVAEPVNSTLTAEGGRKDVALAQEGAAPRDLLEQTATLSPTFHSAGQGGGAGPVPREQGRALASNAQNTQNNSGASAPSAASGGGAATTIQDPRAQVQDHSDAINAGPILDAGVVANNEPPKAPTSTSTVSSTSSSPGTTSVGGDKGERCDGGAAVTKRIDGAGWQRVHVPYGCKQVRIRAWGAGGGRGGVTGNSNGTDGGAGAYAYLEIAVDGVKNDLAVVVGGAGADGKRGSSSGGQGGYRSGGQGGAQGGGGGGGYSGVFLADYSEDENLETPYSPQSAILVAAGGGGGGLNGAGGAGGDLRADGDLGATPSAGGVNGDGGGAGALLLGGAGLGGGGGGGGGFYGGGGGGLAVTAYGGGGGGNGFYKSTGKNFVLLAGHGTTAGNANFSARGSAGNVGHSGMVILEFTR